jgi:2-C-methyl-D-erythritol 4-phosphate cytidylyltransferase
MEDGRITGTVDRRRLRRALTPQAFRFELLRRAFLEVAFDENTTDECSMVEQLGVQIAAVDGDSRNIKVTHPEDLLLAEIFLKELG